jgi:hypothetical protein
MDVVAASTLPPAGMMGIELARPEHVASLLWLEQTSGHHFVQHTLELDRPQHTALELRDADADGDLDIFVSEMNQAVLEGGRIRKVASTEAWVSVWLNAGKPQPPSQR